MNRPGRPGAVLPRIHPNAGADSDAAENGFGGVLGVESEPEKRNATTTSPLNLYVQNQNLLLAMAAEESITGVDRQ